MPTDLSKFGAEPVKASKKTDLSKFGAVEEEPKESVVQTDLSGNAAAELPNKFIPLKDAGLAAAEGVTMGTAPAIMAAGKQIGRMFSGEENAADPRNFKQDVQESRQPFEEARARNPGQYATAQIGSSLLTQGLSGLGKAPAAIGRALPKGFQTLGEAAVEAGIGATQDVASGGDGSMGAVVGSLVPGAKVATQALGGGLSKLVGGLTKWAAPETTIKPQVTQFIDNPALYDEAKLTSKVIPELEKQAKSQAGAAETSIQAAVDRKRAGFDDAYGKIREMAAQSQDMIPSTGSTFDKSRQQITKALGDPELEPVQKQLQEVFERTGARAEIDKSIDPTNTVQSLVIPKDITKGENLNNSIELRKQIDAILKPYRDAPSTGPSALNVNDQRIKQKLQQLRASVDDQIKSAKDFDPAAAELLNPTDAQYRQYRAAKDTINENLGDIKTTGEGGYSDRTTAEKIASSAETYSPDKQKRVQKALDTVEDPTAMDPYKNTQKEIERQRGLAVDRGLLTAEGPILKHGVNIATGLPKITDKLTENPVTRHLQNIVRSQQVTTLPEINSSAQTNEKINREYKDNPTLANWLKIVSKSGRAELPESALESAAAQHKVDKERLRQSLINLGKTITP